MNKPELRTVQIPGSEQHAGQHLITITVAWVCPVCGGARGPVFRTISYDGSRRLGCDGWANPCGHTDLYAAVRREAKNGTPRAPFPRRIRLSRRNGWRLPAGARSVARPTPWGNPYQVAKDTTGQQPRWVVTNDGSARIISAFDTIDQARAKAVDLYREWVLGQPDLTRRVRLELAGRDLACWCPGQAPCHADVLLQLANPGSTR